MPIDDGCCHNSPSAADEGHKLVSIKGSNKTVKSPSVVLGKRKKTDDEGLAAQAQLDIMIEDALELRQLMMLSKTNPEVNKALKGQNYSISELVLEDKIDSELEAELREKEQSIRAHVKSLKKLKLLPDDWEYDPETASTLVSAEPDIMTFRTTTRKERRALLQNKIDCLKGKNYAQLRNVLYKKNKELMKDLEYRNDSEPERVYNNRLDSIKGSNKTVKSPSEVLRKRKRTDEGDGDAASKTIPNDSESESSEDTTNSESDLAKEIEFELQQFEDPIREPVITRSLRKGKKTDEGDGDAASKIIPNESESESSEDKSKSESELAKEMKFELQQFEDPIREPVITRSLRKRKKTDEGDGDAASKIIPNESESESSEDKSKSESELAKEMKFELQQFEDPIREPVITRSLRKRKKTDEGDGAAASKRIPWELHLQIQGTLEFRAEVMQYKLEAKKSLTGKIYSESELDSEDKNDSESDSDDYLDVQLKACEDRIRSLAKRFKKRKQLPHDWEYDPATASTFVAAEEDISALPKRPTPKDIRLMRCSWLVDPNQKFPKTTDVPLDEEEKKIWTDFKEFDKDKFGLDAVDVYTVRESDIPLALDNPIVSLTSKFAVTAFNEAIEMYVKKGEQNNIYDFDVVKCDYLKLNKNSYYFYLTIEAFEERKRGVYDAKVKLNWDDGSKSLMHFVLTDRKPHVLKETTELKLKTHPDSWQDGSRIRHSGIRCRRNRRSICRGFDYHTPWGHGGP